MPQAIFPHDTFLGARGTSHATGGFAISRLQATVPEDGVLEHTHAEAHFVLLLRGRYVSSARGAPNVAEAPMLVYNPPGTRHRDRFRGEGGAFLTLAVSLAEQARCEDVLRMPDYACVAGSAARDRAQRLAAMLTTGTASALELESTCVELMDATASDYAHVQERAPAWLRRARECLRESDPAVTDLSAVAHACSVHPVYLARAFRRHLGCSPGEYQRRCRLNRAAALLADGGTSLSAVAQQCGYFDQAHFTHAFGEAFGQTPGRYRAAYRGRAGSAGTRRAERLCAE